MVGCTLVGVTMVLGGIKERVPEYLINIYKNVSFVPSIQADRGPNFARSTL